MINSMMENMKSEAVYYGYFYQWRMSSFFKYMNMVKYEKNCQDQF